ncbi:MAG: AMP-binding enzyme [Spirochaeta sp.]
MQLSRTNCLRFTTDFIITHLKGMRGGWTPPLEDTESRSSTPLTGDPWYMDSLELVTLAGMLTETFQVHETGIEDLFLARPSISEWAQIIKTSLQNYSSKMVFYTSGSTGRPKPVEHLTSLLDEEIQELAREIHLPVRRVISFVPSNHIYGFLFSLLLPQYISSLQSEKVPVEHKAGGSSRPGCGPGDMILAVPALLRVWRTSGVSFPPGTTVISSTAPLPKEDAIWLLQQNVHLLEVFGSSETAGIGVRHNTADGFRLLPYWERQTKGSGNTGQDFLIRDGLAAPVALPDNLTWMDERRFDFVKRHDNAVQVNGINVYPARIAERLTALPQVSQSMVRSYEGPSGTRLKAYIVPSSQYSGKHLQLEQELRGWSSQHLSSPERPAVYHFGDKLPATVMGKPADF